MRRLMYRTTLASVIATLAFISAAAELAAQSYPSKSVRIIVPQGAGGMADMIGRFLANGMTQDTKQPAVVENRAGGGTMIGSDLVAKAEPDGHTLLLGTVSLAIVPAIDGTLPFNPATDLVPISEIAQVANVLLIHKSVPAQNLKELIDYAKKNPGKLSYASQGVGTTGHMAGELFKQAAGIDITHVPYRGSAPAAQDLIAGHVQLLFDVLPLAVANLKNGSIRAIAIAAPQRAAALPDVPTTAEAGFAVVQTAAWFGLFAPKGTPDSVVKWLHDVVKKVFAAPDIREKLTAQGALLPLSDPATFKEFMARDTVRWRGVAETGKIKVQAQ